MFHFYGFFIFTLRTGLQHKRTRTHQHICTCRATRATHAVVRVQSAVIISVVVVDVVDVDAAAADVVLRLALNIDTKSSSPLITTPLHSRHKKSALVLRHLLLVAAATPATTGALEFAALGAHVRTRVRVRHAGRLAEVTERGASGALALDEQRTLAGRRAHGQLIEGEDLTAGGQDATARLLGDAQGAQLQLGDLQDAGVIGDGADDHGDRVLAGALLQEAGDALQRDRRLIGAAHKETAQHDLVELLVGAAVQEAVQLRVVV